MAWTRGLNVERGVAREEVTAFAVRVRGGTGGIRDSVMRGGPPPVPRPETRLSHVGGSKRVRLTGGESATNKESPRFGGEDSRGRMMNWTNPTGRNRVTSFAEGPWSGRISEEVSWIHRLNGEYGGVREDVTAFSIHVHGGSAGGPRDSVMRHGPPPVPRPETRLSNVRGSNSVLRSGGKSATNKESPRFGGEDSRGG